MSDSALHFTKRELQRTLLAPRFWAVLLGAALLIGVTGPFGTFESLPLLPRIAYWVGISAATMICGLAVVLAATRWMQPQGEPSWQALAAAGALAGLPIAAIVWTINAQTFQGAEPIHFGPLLVYCVAISVVVSLLIRVAAPIGWKEREEEERATEPEPGLTVRQPAPLLSRLPAHLRGKLLRLSMQDHYVEVHTDKGSALVLMRLADAIGETQGVEGLQIHRSHWVALEAATRTVRREGRLFVETTDGALLPVSRSFAEAVRDAGLA